jgi:hypothetical protein
MAARYVSADRLSWKVGRQKRLAAVTGVGVANDAVAVIGVGVEIGAGAATGVAAMTVTGAGVDGSSRLPRSAESSR